MRRVIALAATFTLWLALPASAGGPNNVVVSSPSSDGAKIHRVSIKVGSTGSDTVDSSNVAYAAPHDCTGCEGIAVAFQAIIMTGKPTTFTPKNYAVAINTSCTGCGAFAYAYQYTVSAERGTHLGKDGRAKVAAIRRDADAAVDAGLPYDQLDARLKALSTQFKTAVDQDLERSGADPHDGGRDDDVDEAGTEQ
jgi:putative peptide zinc metalloprotease protein